ncbi:MAG: FecR domain-containing protein [Planctomycetota bacterium]
MTTELSTLCERVCSGRATDDEVAELESLMADDPAAAQHYLNWAALHTDLIGLLVAQASPVGPFDPEAAPPTELSVVSADSHASPSSQSAASRSNAAADRPSQPTWGFRGAAMAAAVTLLTLVGSLYLSRPAEELVQAPQRPAALAHLFDGTAILNRADDVVWKEGSRQAAVGELLRSHHCIEFQSGVLEIEFGQGAVVVLEGPAKFCPVSTSLGELDHGKLAAVVPPWADGFRIDTPKLEVVDRGTEFVVEVTTDQEVNVGVAKGEVELFGGSDDDTPSLLAENRRLTAGDAVSANGRGIVDRTYDERWKRLSQRLPERPDHSQVEVVAKYRRDFVTGAPDKQRLEGRWRYYANVFADVSDSSGYRELLWDPDREVYDPNGTAGRIAGSRLGAANFSYRGGHPGQGRDQTKDDTDHYVVAAFQVPQSGVYSIESGWLVRAESRNELANQFVDLRVRVNDRPDVIEETCNANGLLRFRGDLGDLQKDDWIYIAVGPSGVSYNDRFEWDFAIVREVPQPVQL